MCGTCLNYYFLRLFRNWREFRAKKQVFTALTIRIRKVRDPSACMHDVSGCKITSDSGSKKATRWSGQLFIDPPTSCDVL